jgi:hypothetical protein
VYARRLKEHRLCQETIRIRLLPGFSQARFNFELSGIANMDQTPISFEFLGGRTYDTTGVRTVFVKQTGSGWDRRQATLQILVHADGIQRCKPLLIFHGKNEDHRQKPISGPLRREYRLYDSRVELSVVLEYYGSLVLISSR